MDRTRWSVAIREAKRMRLGGMLMVLLAIFPHPGRAEDALPSEIGVADFDTWFEGIQIDERAGLSIAAIRDINGDNLDDLAIGAPYADTEEGSNTGRVYIVFGRPADSDFWRQSINLEEADLILTGEEAGDELGSQVAQAGDVNCDGEWDLLVSAPYNAQNGSVAGKVYLVFGRSEGWPTEPTVISEIADASWMGEAGEAAGYAIAGIGSLDNDWCGEIAIGDSNYILDEGTKNEIPYAGRAYVLFGHESGWSTDQMLQDAADIVIEGEVRNQFVGRTLFGPVDLDGDGLEELIVGSPGAVPSDNDPDSYRGAVGVLWGRFSGWNSFYKFSDLDVIFEGEDLYDEAGAAIAAVPDFTGDGYWELLIGAPSYTIWAGDSSIYEVGKTYVFPGRSRDKWAEYYTLDEAEGSFVGLNYHDQAGSALGAAGDFNGDGRQDFLIGAPLFDSDDLSNPGRVYLILGTEDLQPDVSLDAADMIISGDQYDARVGYSLTTAVSDLDGDYHRDFVIGSPRYDNGSDYNLGAIYVARGGYFGDSDDDGYSPYAGDCDDDAPDIHPGADEIPYDGIDQDCDGADLRDVDGDGFTGSAGDQADDCDDTDPSIYPGAEEHCDGVDEDCDGGVDEGVTVTLYPDHDGDGYGVDEGALEGCRPDDSLALVDGDCDDGDAGIYPGAREIPYDGIDQDCDGYDEVDHDADGYCAAGLNEEIYADSVNALGEACETDPALHDCDDDAGDVNPGQTDVPYDGVDQDCDGSDLLDVDGDGYDWDGRLGDDCDDTDPAIHPGAEEIPYDGIDQDCDGTDLEDQDGDGFIAAEVGGGDCLDTDASVYPGADDVPDDGIDANCNGQDAHDADQDGFSVDGDLLLEGQDCNDDDASIYPGAEEVPYDGVDQDCSGGDLIDVDGDGVSGAGDDPDDCDDSDSAIYPGAPEQPYDGIDQDCDGSDLTDVDGDGYSGGEDGPDCNDDDPTIHPGADEIDGNEIDENCDTILGDRDLDGFGVTDDPADCNDEDSVVYPNADEIPYDGIDQDCNGEDLTDVDGDGVTAAEVGGADCDDTDAAVYPGAAEIPGDGLDNDCDGLTDPGDQDGDGYSVEEGDCNDQDPAVHPGRTENVGDEIDNDCDGRIDERVTGGEESAGGCHTAGSGGLSVVASFLLLFVILGRPGRVERRR